MGALPTMKEINLIEMSRRPRPHHPYDLVCTVYLCRRKLTLRRPRCHPVFLGLSRIRILEPLWCMQLRKKGGSFIRNTLVVRMTYHLQFSLRTGR